MFEPPDFIARLAALVPKPRVRLTRFHKVFAPNSDWRAQVAGQGDTNQAETLMARVLEHFGQIDILVNNAAVAWQGRGWTILRSTTLRWIASGPST